MSNSNYPSADAGVKSYRNENHIAGDVFRDPITRFTPTGKKICTLTVVTKYKQYSENHRIVLWQELADKAGKLRKGDFVRIVGRLQTRSWQDKETNEKKYVTEIIAFQIAIPSEEPEALTPDSFRPNGTELARSILRPAKKEAGDDDCGF